MNTKFAVTIAIMLLSIAFLTAYADRYGVEVPDYSVTVGEHTLPFEDYPHGSYFTNNGKACKPHPQGVCSNCKNTYGDLKLGAIQCKGFAHMVFYRLFGVRGHDTEDKGKYIDIVKNVSGKKITEEYIKEIFTSGNIKPGAHIRIKNVHSLVFLGCDGEHFYTYEAGTNIPGDKHRYTCRVTLRKRTIAEAAQYFKRTGITYVRMPLSEDYPESVAEIPEVPELPVAEIPDVIDVARVLEIIMRV